MKISEIISEAEVTPYQYQILTPRNAAYYIFNHCRDALKILSKPLWRGIENHTESALLIDPSTGTRKSQNSLNHYQGAISAEHTKPRPLGRGYVASSTTRCRSQHLLV